MIYYLIEMLKRHYIKLTFTLFLSKSFSLPELELELVVVDIVEIDKIEM